MSHTKPVTKVLLVLLITILFSCESANKVKEKGNEVATATEDTGKTEEKPFANIQFASQIDTSCGMPLTAGIGDTLHLNSKIYGFCSADCKDEFANKLIAEKKR